MVQVARSRPWAHKKKNTKKENPLGRTLHALIRPAAWSTARVWARKASVSVEDIVVQKDSSVPPLELLCWHNQPSHVKFSWKCPMHWDEEVNKHMAAQPEGRLPGHLSLQWHNYIQSITSHDFNVFNHLLWQYNIWFSLIIFTWLSWNNC